MPVAAVVCLLVGVVCGSVNGFLVAVLGLPSLAVTIGTLASSAASRSACSARPRSPPSRAVDRPGQGRDRRHRHPGGRPGLPRAGRRFAWLLHFSAFGRGVYDIGLNTEAAEFTGVPVRRTSSPSFVLSATVSALAGIYFTLRFTSARGDNATGLELQVIAAVLLGGVSIFGGRGKLHGVVAGGAADRGALQRLRLLGVTVDVINIIIGLLLVASVMSSSVLAWVSNLAARRHHRGARPSSAPTGAGTPER